MVHSFSAISRRLSRITAALVACTPLWACGSDVDFFLDDADITPEVDHAVAATLPPLASAGPDREVLRGYRTQLDATGTWSLDDAALTLTWQQTSGEPVYLSNPNDAAPYFIAPLDEQKIAFTLSVTNGAFTVTDDVVIVVSNEPRRIAPVVNGGPDQVGYELDQGPASPAFAPSAVAVTWEEVTPDRTALAARKASYNGPRIYKLVGVEAGLGSAPDYVLVHPPTVTEGAPPISNVEGPAIAATGSVVTLAASGSGGNGHLLSYHWEQTRGAPVLQTLGTKTPQLGIDIPRVSQQLVFRVHAFDGLLASAPSEIVLEVLPGDGLHPGQLVPGSDVRARPGSEVKLFASTENATPGAELAWQQTRGATALFAQADDHILFPVPASNDELAFVVSSTIDHAESNPAAYRIVVTGDGNSAPRISACVPTGIAPGSIVLVSVRVTDPDGDSLTDVSASLDATPVPADDEAAVTGSCAIAPSAAVGSSVTRVYPVEAPLSGSLQLAISATDARDATRSVSVTIP